MFCFFFLGSEYSSRRGESLIKMHPPKKPQVSDLQNFLTLSNKVEKCFCIQFVCLSVHPVIYRITQKISDIVCVILGNSWICILKILSWFVSIILNFNALFDAYTVQIQKLQCYSKFKSGRILWLMLGISF